MRNPNRDAAGASASLIGDTEASTPKTALAQVIGALALPLTRPPAIGRVVILYGDNHLCAVARYHGDGWWEVLDERFPDIEPTHWLMPNAVSLDSSRGRPH